MKAIQLAIKMLSSILLGVCEQDLRVQVDGKFNMSNQRDAVSKKANAVLESINRA